MCLEKRNIVFLLRVKLRKHTKFNPNTVCLIDVIFINRCYRWKDSGGGVVVVFFRVIFTTLCLALILQEIPVNFNLCYFNCFTTVLTPFETEGIPPSQFMGFLYYFFLEEK